MESRFFKFRNYLLISFFFMLGLSCEKGKNNSTETSLSYELTQIAETDSTISFQLLFTKPIKNLSLDGQKISLVLTELLVSIQPVVDSGQNFISFLLTGNAHIAVDSILTGAIHGYSPRGMILTPLLINNTFTLDYRFTIERELPIYFIIHLLMRFVLRKKTHL